MEQTYSLRFVSVAFFTGLLMGGFVGLIPVMITLCSVYLYLNFGAQFRYIITRLLDEKFNLPPGFSNNLLSHSFGDNNLENVVNYLIKGEKKEIEEIVINENNEEINETKIDEIIEETNEVCIENKRKNPRRKKSGLTEKQK